MPRPTKRQSVYMAASPRMHKEMARRARKYRAAGFSPPRQGAVRSSLREQERDYLLAAARADQRRARSAKTREDRRARVRRHLYVVYGVWLLLVAGLLLFGEVVWLFFLIGAFTYGSVPSRRPHTPSAHRPCGGRAAQRASRPRTVRVGGAVVGDVGRRERPARLRRGVASDRCRAGNAMSAATNHMPRGWRSDEGSERGMRANEEWRNDPERRHEAAEADDRWRGAAKKALALVVEADRVLREARAWQDREDPLAVQVETAATVTFRAKLALERIDLNRANDTRIGNMAAFGVGHRRH